MSSVTPHTEGGSLCLITVGLDPEATQTVKQAAMQESVKFISAFPDYLQNVSPAQLEEQMQGAEALVCLIDFDKNKDMAVQAATNLQPLLNGRTALIALSGDENPGLILEAMRAGCNEYLTRPLQEWQLSSCLQKLRARWLSSPVHQPRTAGQVLVFLGVRGGAESLPQRSTWGRSWCGGTGRRCSSWTCIPTSDTWRCCWE